jgi:hypothetical protein
VEAAQREAIRLYYDLGNDWAVAYTLFGLAGVRLAGGDVTTATVLLAAGKAWFERFGLVIDPPDRAAVESYVVAAREALGPKAFEDTWRRGASLSFADAVAPWARTEAQ